MANRHFAKVADVWKHLPLVEVLSIERPRRYWESHAGSAVYEMADDAERRYGALTFIEVAPLQPALARSRYLAHLRSLRGPSGRLASYPGSPMLAALELGSTCSYVFCDLDPDSVADLRSAARRLDLASRTEVVGADGMATLHHALTSSDPGSTLAHIDPYDPCAVGAGGQSALDFAHELIERGVGVVYWYGYDRPQGRAWAFDELSAGRQRTTVWCGDMMITGPGTAPDDGDLGVATTPGTGFGIVCANVSTPTIDACRALGEGLAAAYDGVPLPDGRPGRLEFTTRAAS